MVLANCITLHRCSCRPLHKTRPGWRQADQAGAKLILKLFNAGVMETLKFKTNIKCDGCVATVTPHLNEAVGEKSWRVDLTDINRTLTVEGSEGSDLAVVEALARAGYKAEKIS